jgi:putative ABC transport system ATP-binding protein
MNASEPVISMSQVCHSYGAGALRRQILFDVTCDIAPGEIVIITGPSGSGKTTVLTLAGALRSVQDGTMRVLGQELNGAGHDTLVQIRENIGFIFQAHNLLDSLTAIQNVQMSIGLDGLPLGEVRARSAAMLDAVGLGDRLHHYPSQLSGGERQRVAVARALVRRPKIVLADEPTAALDKQSGRDVVELLRQLARREGCTVLLATHDSRILDIADRLMRLEDGRLGSFDQALSPYAGHLLTVLAHVWEKDHLRVLMNRPGEGEFVEFLNAMGAEVEQLLNILNLGGRESIQRLLDNLLDIVLLKIAETVGAVGAAFFGANGERLRTALEPPGWPSEALVARAIESGRIVNVSAFDLGPGIHSVLCVPLRDRQGDIVAAAQLINKANGGSFTDADEWAFRDFATPLGLILEAWQRVHAMQ